MKSAAPIRRRWRAILVSMPPTTNSSRARRRRIRHSLRGAPWTTSLASRLSGWGGAGDEARVGGGAVDDALGDQAVVVGGHAVAGIERETAAHAEPAGGVIVG